jgi:hypothetical protein
MNGYQTCALLLGLYLLVGTGMILWNRFRSKKTIGLVELFIRIQIVVFMFMAVVEDVFRFLLLVLLVVSLLGWGVHWVVKHKNPDYHPAKGWIFGKQWVFVAGEIILLGSILNLGQVLFRHGPIWTWEIIHGRVMK